MDKRKAPSASEPTPDDPEQFQRFLETARELGCDPGDPRIRDVLRGMAAQPHQARSESGAKGKTRAKG